MARVAVITGANRGLGFATAEALARKGHTVVLTARTLDKARQAAAALAENGLVVDPFAVDVADDAQVRALGEHVAEKYGRCDVLVNNAGAITDPGGWGSSDSSVFAVAPALVAEAFGNNTLGALRMVQALVPLMQRAGYGRVVNVSSGMAGLTEMGGKFPAYRLSKVALNAITRIVSSELAGFPDIKINSVCPGWVRTDMGGSRATRSVEEGILGIVWAATLPSDGPSGGFFRDGKPIPW